LEIVGNDINIDVRSAGMSLFNSLGVAELVWTLYPRMFAVHELAPECGAINDKGQITLPPMMRASYERLDPQGAYIVGK
jgi:protein transport protein SEC24